MDKSPDPKKVLVTGASGFLGSWTVVGLSEKGYAVRALVRSASKAGGLAVARVEFVTGDISEARTLRPAFEGVDYVIHAAADTTGTEEGGRLSTIQGTQHILQLCEEHRVKKLVYISSCSVYGLADLKSHQLVKENAPLERFPEQRGAYSWAKAEAEKLVRGWMSEERLPIVCLRPGMIYGPGGVVFTPMLGFSFGDRIFLVIGNGRFILPLVHVENAVQAILLALESPRSNGGVFNIVDPDRINKRTYMEALVRRFHPRARVLFLPHSLVEAAVFLQEGLFTLVRLKPILTRYRLASSQHPVIFDSSKIRQELGWQPKKSFQEAIEELLAEG